MNIRELARICGVSRSAASLALRSDPRSSGIVQRRVQEIARRLGYRPDPKLAAVLSQISRKRQKQIAAPIAVLSNWPHPREWERNWILKQFHDGIVSRATELGYRVDDFWLAEPGMTDRRMRSVLVARGIEGAIVLNYSMVPAILQMDLGGFSAVVIGRVATAPRLAAVDHNHQQGLRLALAELLRRGYRRVGLALCSSMQEGERSEHQWEGAWRILQHRKPLGCTMPLCLLTTWDQSRFMRWVIRHDLDAVIGTHSIMLNTLHEFGVHVPADVGFATLMCGPDRLALAGIDMNCHSIGVIATDLVTQQMHARPGVPYGHTLLVDGIWRDGDTVRPPAEMPTADAY